MPSARRARDEALPDARALRFRLSKFRAARNLDGRLVDARLLARAGRLDARRVGTGGLVGGRLVVGGVLDPGGGRALGEALLELVDALPEVAGDAGEPAAEEEQKDEGDDPPRPRTGDVGDDAVHAPHRTPGLTTGSQPASGSRLRSA